MKSLVSSDAKHRIFRYCEIWLKKEVSWRDPQGAFAPS